MTPRDLSMGQQVLCPPLPHQGVRRSQALPSLPFFSGKPSCQPKMPLELVFIKE